MAVMLVTSVGDLVIDLFTDQCPLATKNFLKLCKIKYYNNCLFHSVQKDFIAQTGDPTVTGTGGDSIYKFLYGDQARFFDDEFHPNLKHDKVGVVAMASAGENANASQFYITSRAELDYLDGKHTVFGEVGEGLETLMRINESFVDEKYRPYKNIRIKHSIILDDPFDDPAGLADLIPDKSPELKPPAEGEEVRLEDDWVPMDETMDPEELEKSLRKKEAQSRAVVLEMIGDLPEAEMKPPENVLFVCKLNPVTEEGDLELIFGRFGKVKSADIIRDYKTGDSLCYAFIEFETEEACEAAYFKMDNVLIDDRRIHVDFSQSVSHLWNRYRKFGSKGGDGQSNFGRGCFKCGEMGHLAQECPNDGEQKDGPPEKPKYTIKDTGGQRGNTSKRYEMVFDDEGDEARQRVADKHREGSHKSSRGTEVDSRKAGAEDRGGRREYYAEQDGTRSQEGRQQERDRDVYDKRPDRGFERPRQERDRDRSGGRTYSERSQNERETAELDDRRMTGRHANVQSRSPRASERTRPEDAKRRDAENAGGNRSQGKGAERSHDELRRDDYHERSRVDSRTYRDSKDKMREKDYEDHKRDRVKERSRHEVVISDYSERVRTESKDFRADKEGTREKDADDHRQVRNEETLPRGREDDVAREKRRRLSRDKDDSDRKHRSSGSSRKDDDMRSRNRRH